MKSLCVQDLALVVVWSIIVCACMMCLPGTKKEREGLTATFSVEVGAGARKTHDRDTSSHTFGARVS